jgi:membrane peptidoglycan carboxypeptidase
MGKSLRVDAAANFYFGNPPARSPCEAAMLCGTAWRRRLVPSGTSTSAARGRANVVLDNLVEAGS